LRIPVVCFVGRKNSGKTTLMEKIIAGLKAAGHRVGAVKHDVHRFEIDHPGKDGWRFPAAGEKNIAFSGYLKVG
jgi:molybdopterin-guanine dinucleotide biosynthesis protein MobB